MADLRNHIKTFFLTLFCLLISISELYSQETKRDNSPIIQDENHFFLKGINEFNNKNYPASKKAFSKVLELNPDNDAAYFYLANMTLTEGDIPTGEMLLNRAIEKDSSNFWYKNLLANIYISTKRPDSAIEVYEGLLYQFPKKKEIYYNLTNLYVNQENIEKAHETLDKIEGFSGRNEGVIMTRFNLYRMSKDLDGALSYLVESNNMTSSPRIETIIGDLYAGRRMDSLAVSYYQKALKGDSGYIPALYGEAEIYRQRGEYPTYFQKISPIISNPQIESRIKSEYLGQLLQIPGFVNRCKASLDTLVDSFANTHPTDSLANYLASAYFSQTGNKEKCKELLRKIHLQNPDNKHARMQYLSFLYYGNEWELLKEETSNALQLLPEDMELLELLGLAHYQSGAIPEAISTYQKINGIALKNNDTTNIVSSYSTLGDLYHQTGNTKMAYLHYNKTLKVNPNYNPVLNNYAYFLALENKNLKKAYKMSKKSIESEPDNPTYLDTFAWILYLMGKPDQAKGHLKHAMLYGGMESADILDHYAEILFALEEYDLAFIYWEQAHKKDPSLGLDKKIEERKAALNRK